MDKVDGTEHYNFKAPADLATLQVIILDTNPLAWAKLEKSSSLSFPSALSQLLIFANAHLAFSQSNRCAVIANHIDGAHFLSPADPGIDPRDPGEADLTPEELKEIAQQNASKYRVFRLLEDEVRASYRRLIMGTTPAAVMASPNGSSMAGALGAALSYINRICFGGTGGRSTGVPGDEKSKVTSAGGKVDDTGRTMHAKILVVSVTPDPANQYIPVMNSIFASQRLKVPIDVCKLQNATVFLQQAADATGGVYMEPEHPQGLLQYLMVGFLPDHLARRSLILPTKVDVDFRAACFCHKKVMDIGFVCSICLSIFCDPPEGAVCSTCQVKLDVTSLENLGKPVVLPAKKKKKKKAIDSLPESGVASAADSPAPAD
ncbi:RNA polymerase II transcription factor B subunit 4 [Orbilia blumenaviensis]|uniref:General transcription and DNA repair factor IIH subunit TFB4 n=1 Tax=Orbilia blumenaviensis TaxID=1796055 RepID=A0AAV9UND4_9PEZI